MDESPTHHSLKRLLYIIENVSLSHLSDFTIKIGSVQLAETGTALGWRPQLARILAEEVGFEPTKPLRAHAFQACAIGHYATLPIYLWVL